MRIGAYQFNVCGNISNNMKHIVDAIHTAAQEHIRLLVFPECALTGYPPRDIESSRNVNFEEVNQCIDELRGLSKKYGMFLLSDQLFKEKIAVIIQHCVFIQVGI